MSDVMEIISDMTARQMRPTANTVVSALKLIPEWPLHCCGC
jgi:hypothetical protein